ncbi:MAG: response regulator [Acidaminococcaceae bacterium]|nr:response regulator [Acidaminococcaceae bacterium]
MESKKNNIVKWVVLVGSIIIAAIVVLGTIWTGQSARKDTEAAVRSVSLLYLNELAGRREQVVASNLQSSISNMRIAIGMMTPEDLQDMEHLQAFQAKMKKLYSLDKFAFVDSNGRIYTSKGIQTDINSYKFDYKALTRPEISVKNEEGKDKKVVIAIPMTKTPFNGQTLVASFMELDMKRMLEGVSLQSDDNNTTFCNIYTNDGQALTDVVLGGMAREKNLLEALKQAKFEEGFSAETVARNFAAGHKGVASFTYNNLKETMYYVPVKGTDWMLSYLISESLISNEISSISDGIITRSQILTALMTLVLLGLFAFLFGQMRRSSQLALEKEKSDTENRVKQEELEQRIVLQEELLEQEKKRVQQDRMITALASDYRSVYYVELDSDSGICYRTDLKMENALQEGEAFSFKEVISSYADRYVDESYKEGFLDFVKPENIRAGLEKNAIISYRYLIHRNGQESYEMLRMAGVRHPEDRADHIVHAIGIGFSDVDAETRESMAKSQALSDALAVAEEANRAKTAFLSNMSHEIRTPMNAIIGLDNIALHEAGISAATRNHLEKIGSSARHLLSLINDILDMTRIESGRMSLKNEEFSISGLLEQINTLVSEQCHDKGLHYNCHIKGHLDDYYIGDDIKLRQIIINILSNAVKFTPEGGNIDFTLERIAHFNDKSTLRLTIRDNGIGMDKSFLPRIFESFSQEDSSSTNKYGSSGLGMAITKSIVEMMNGKIEVDSEKGKGTVFTVTVTLMDAHHQADKTEESVLQPHDLSVLIVDDDEVACEHARLILEKVGISSQIARSGEEALEKVRFRSARHEFFNLILVDWKMPGMDGVETTRQIRSIVGNGSAIIILTAYKWDDVLEEALNAGVDSFVSKPLFASNVLDEFNRAFKKKNMSPVRQDHKADLKGRRVLVAEDMDINAEILVMLLKMRDVQADRAENGRIAVDMFSSHPENYYDAILMDIRMPEMDGLEATETIRSLDRDDAKTIPVVALTANAFDTDVQKSLQAGLNVHLSKPVEPEKLYSTLETLIWEKEHKKDIL